MADPGSGPTGFGHVLRYYNAASNCLPLTNPHYPDGSQAVLLDATIGAGGTCGTVLRICRVSSTVTQPLWTSRGPGWCDLLTGLPWHTRHDCSSAALAELVMPQWDQSTEFVRSGVSSMVARAERGFAYATDARHWTWMI